MRFGAFDVGAWMATTVARLSGQAPPSEGIIDALDLLQQQAPRIVFDRRKEPKAGRRARSRGRRSWESVRGVTLHQTGVGPGAISRKRIPRVPTHAVIDNLGNIHLLWDPTHVLWHAHALNRESVGVEIDCRSGGERIWLSKKERARGLTADDVRREPVPAQLQAARALCSYYRTLLGLNRGDDRQLVIWAHRQGHWSRTADPGEQIWRGVALRLLADPTRYISGGVRGTGTDIPPDWTD